MGQQEPKDQPHHSRVPAAGTPEPLGLPGSGSPRKAPSPFASPQAHHGGFKPAREGGAAREGKGGTGDGTFEEKDFLGPSLLSGPPPLSLWGAGSKEATLAPPGVRRLPPPFCTEQAAEWARSQGFSGVWQLELAAPRLFSQPAVPTVAPPQVQAGGRRLQTGMGRCARRRHELNTRRASESGGMTPQDEK